MADFGLAMLHAVEMIAGYLGLVAVAVLFAHMLGESICKLCEGGGEL